MDRDDGDRTSASVRISTFSFSTAMSVNFLTLRLFFGKDRRRRPAKIGYICADQRVAAFEMVVEKASLLQLQLLGLVRVSLPCPSLSATERGHELQLRDRMVERLSGRR